MFRGDYSHVALVIEQVREVTDEVYCVWAEWNVPVKVFHAVL